MSHSETFLVKSAWEFIPKTDTKIIPPQTRGVYVLFDEGPNGSMNVVYVGMARGDRTGAAGRLHTHRKTKDKLWTHFSVYEVWDNITSQQVEELEGLFRHFYRRDVRAKLLNVQKSYAPLTRVTRKTAAARAARHATKRGAGA